MTVSAGVEALAEGGGGDTSRQGISEVLALNVTDRANAAVADAYTFLNVEVTGDTVTWDHEWESGNGVMWCGNGHTAAITEGRFVTWTYAPSDQIAPCTVTLAEALDSD